MKAEFQKIGIGMSGGVDSSVSALLLKNAGYDVVGITMLLKPERILSETERKNRNHEAEDARLVCEKLGILHLTPDFSEVFEEKVISYFTEAYFSGKTPNPCLMCNKHLKFGSMLDFALQNGCDAVATGHYAKVEQREDGRYLLLQADSRKDQSYFLYSLNQYQLGHILFPLNIKEKTEARALAAEYGLPVANKPDSQEICFVQNRDYIRFIETYARKRAPKGRFVNEDGQFLGEHGGIYRYTIGQRKGFGISFGEPMFVTAMDAVTNTVTLGREGSQYSNTLIAGDTNFIPFDTLEESMKITAKVRYQAKPAAATLTPLQDGTVFVEFEEPQRSVTPGQAVVFYSRNLVMGGGIIR
ncbi:MAG: tRNA 2-thiouridine(34) synthase MnmA [Oscillospiraceae bacterium]